MTILSCSQILWIRNFYTTYHYSADSGAGDDTKTVSQNLPMTHLHTSGTWAGKTQMLELQTEVAKRALSR